MTEPKLTEAQREALWSALVSCSGPMDGLVPEVARMVAEAEQTARAEERAHGKAMALGMVTQAQREAWDDGYAAADWRDQNFVEPVNPYRSTP